MKDTLALTGAVAGHWALFERTIDVAIWRTAKIDPDIGACLTAQIQSVRQKLITLETLVDFTGGDEKGNTIKQLRRLQNKAEEPAKLRNRVVHNPIYPAPVTREIVLWRLTADRRLVFEDEPVSDQDLWNLLDTILALINEFDAIFPRLSAPQAPSSP